MLCAATATEAEQKILEAREARAQFEVRLGSFYGYFLQAEMSFLFPSWWAVVAALSCCCECVLRLILLLRVYQHGC